MNKKIWIFQQKKEVAKKGVAGASWYVGWYDLQSKRHSESCGPGSRGKNLAEKRLRRIQSELDMGVHKPSNKITWKDFRKEYEEQVLSLLAASSQRSVKVALATFERHISPGRLETITTKKIDEFVSLRLKDRGKNPKSPISPATVNKDLRHLKAALRKAHEWEYLQVVPKIKMVREPQKIPRFVTAQHFELIYSEGCTHAKHPNEQLQTYTPVDWWRALIVVAYMTGMRINEILSIRRADLDFEAGQLITRAKDNKGKRDERINLHPVVIEHLRTLDNNSLILFPWHLNKTQIWEEFKRIQQQVGIHVDCPEEHCHTPSCYLYGFHDFRRAFATLMAPHIKGDVLQKLMRHKSYSTTQVYINLTSQMEDAVVNMPVPKILQKPDGKS
ncbi:MAG: site-specific integrase [Zavarzinella sp.]